MRVLKSENNNFEICLEEDFSSEFNFLVDFKIVILSSHGKDSPLVFKKYSSDYNEDSKTLRVYLSPDQLYAIHVEYGTDSPPYNQEAYFFIKNIENKLVVSNIVKEDWI